MLWWVGFIVMAFFLMAIEARIRESPNATAQLSGAVARLGDVLYWAASAVAGLIAAFIAWVEIAGEPNQFAVIVFGGFAVLIWLGGRACRYVLAGR